MSSESFGVRRHVSALDMGDMSPEVESGVVPPQSKKSGVVPPHSKKMESGVVPPHFSDAPAFGPYSKNLIGISHLADRERGLRWDLSVFPGLYRRMVKIPAVRYESDYHPWEAAADLGYYSHRHVIDGRDRLFSEISFARFDEHACTVRAVTTNLTGESFLGVLHYMAAMRFPPLSPNLDLILLPAVAELPRGAVYLGAENYRSVRIGGSDPRRHLPWGAGPYLVGTRNGAVGGTGLYLRPEAGRATLAYELPVAETVKNPALFLRYQAGAATRVEVAVEGGTAHAVDLPACEDFAVVRLMELAPTACDGARSLRVELTFPSCAGEFIDGLIFAGSDAAMTFRVPGWQVVPEMHRIGERGLMLSYPDAPGWYGIAWDSPDAEVRQFRCRELDPFMRDRVHDHVSETLGKDESGHFANVFLRPLRWPAHSETRSEGLVCHGTQDEVAERLREFQADARPFAERHDTMSQSAFRFSANPAGEPYLFSQTRMAATLLTGVVYPVRCRGKWIAHPTPGRWWDSLYTWDAGFIALGLATVAPSLALRHIATYLVPVDSADQAAFVHYGTPLPTQIYAFKEAWELSPDLGTLRRFYPMLRNMHRFLVGRYPNATTRPFGTGLVATWDYFYNSGGWDDYPPQQWVHRHKLTGTVAPIVNTAHAIRTAKLLATFGSLLGEPVEEFHADIAELSEALAPAWDAETGYFGYLCHDEAGRPVGLLRTPDGENFNKGMDGLTPLLAGAGTPDQRRQMLENLLSPAHLMTPIGLTTVDQSAGYYRRDGYWNGAVWMPHQWFFWKALLDLGEGDAAFGIARRALDVWKAEVEASWNCFEHFIVETGRGAGWHQFSGLSCPVLAWFAAYYCQNRITVGHHATITSRQDFDGRTLRFRVRFDDHPPAPEMTVIVTLPPGGNPTATCNGKTVPLTERHPGCIELLIPTSAEAEVVVARE